MIKEFLGHLHPVVVHLPIGILLLACIFQWLSGKERYVALRFAARISLLIGWLSAIIACITGLILFANEDYDEDLVSRHKWFAIGLTVASIAYYFLYRQNQNRKIHFATSLFLFGLIVITGHLGGSITHGPDFLTKPFNDSMTDSAVNRKSIPDIQEAVVYNDVIQPLLQSKCYHCHGKSRQKGGLRMDQPERLMKGGKDGEVILIHDPENSELVRRILLEREEEDHMPPKERPQLKENEIALIHWWISAGAPFDKRVKDLQQPEMIKPILLALQSAGEERMIDPDIPHQTVDKADESSVEELKKHGVVILPVAQNTNYLMANFVTAPKNGDSIVRLLSPLKKQLVWLKLGTSSITDSALQIIALFINLRRLQLDHTQITDKGLAALKNLGELRYLNLVGTRVTAKGILQLKELRNLESLYLYQTSVENSAKEEIKKSFPKTRIDYGGYDVPTLVSDTTVVKPPKKQ